MEVSERGSRLEVRPDVENAIFLKPGSFEYADIQEVYFHGGGCYCEVDGRED